LSGVAERGRAQRAPLGTAPLASMLASVLLACVLLLHPPPALEGQETQQAEPAQQPDPLDPGDRIRVTVVTPTPRLYIGSYQGRTDSTLQLRSGGSPLAIALTTVRRLEQSRGRKLSVAGGVLGFLVGGAGGAALGCLANRDDYGVFCGGQSDTKVAVGAALGGAAGAALGAILFRRERWRPVDAAMLVR
jgi:hypothetical protein